MLYISYICDTEERKNYQWDVNRYETSQRGWVDLQMTLSQLTGKLIVLGETLANLRMGSFRKLSNFIMKLFLWFYKS